MSSFERPGPGEHAEYYSRYVDLVPEGNILDTLLRQLGETLVLLQEVPPERETYRYAPAKWSIREVVGHMIDTERVFAYRALAIARSDSADLPTMDQDEWVRRSGADDRTLEDLSSEWASLRRSNLDLLASLGVEAGLSRGRASGFEITVRSIPWIMAGHELWHRERLRVDYLGGGE